MRLGQRVIFMYHISIKGVPGALDDVGGHVGVIDAGGIGARCLGPPP